MIAGLAASGLPTGRFAFEGFLSVSRRSRQEHLEGLIHEPRTMVFYEAPHKLLSTLRDLRDALGGHRRVALCRELTKLHEETVRMTLAEATDFYTENSPRGEFVLVLEGAPEGVAPCPTEDALKRVERLREEGRSLRDAVRQAAEETGLPRNVLYNAALQK
jgi:16S rRNA (cytidine1402-2'-O)-methyltransferase